MTAQDAANACPCRGTVATMKSLTVVDPLTLDVTLVSPNAHIDKLVERQTGWVRERLKLALKNRLPVLTRMAARALRSTAVRS